MATTPSPTIDFLLVHGAWHGPWVWDLLVPELPGTVHTVVLPSSGPDVAALGDFSDDVAAVRDALTAIGRPTVVVAHSAGGLSSTQAVCGLSNVLGLVYVAAFVPDAGQQVADLFPGPPPEWWDLHPDEGYVDVLDGRRVFFQDVPAELAEASVARLTHQSRAGLDTTLTDAAWRHVPTSYVVCDDDNGVPREVQELMARHAVRVPHLPSGHCPFLSMPKELGTILAEEATAFARSADASPAS